MSYVPYARNLAAAITQGDEYGGSWAPRRALLGHKDRVFDAAFGPRLGTGFELLATGSEDCTARVWRLSASEAPCVHVLQHSQEASASYSEALLSEVGAG